MKIAFAILLILTFSAPPSNMAAEEPLHGSATNEEWRDIEAIAFLVSHYATLLEDRKKLHDIYPDLYPKGNEESGGLIPNIDALLEIPSYNVLMEEKNGACKSIWRDNGDEWQKLLRHENPELKELKSSDASNVCICIRKDQISDFSLSLGQDKNNKDGNPVFLISFTKEFYTRFFLAEVGGRTEGKDLLQDWQSNPHAGSKGWAELNYRFVAMSYTLSGLNYAIKHPDAAKKIGDCPKSEANDKDKDCAEAIWEFELMRIQSLVTMSKNTPIVFQENSKEEKLKLGSFLPPLLGTLIAYNGENKGVRFFVSDNLKRRYPKFQKWHKFWRKK